MTTSFHLVESNPAQDMITAQKRILLENQPPPPVVITKEKYKSLVKAGILPDDLKVECNDKCGHIMGKGSGVVGAHIGGVKYYKGPAICGACSQKRYLAAQALIATVKRLSSHDTGFILPSDAPAECADENEEECQECFACSTFCDVCGVWYWNGDTGCGLH